MLKINFLLVLVFLVAQSHCCPYGCASCGSYYSSNCYSCIYGFFKISYSCYSCSQCSFYNKCSSCQSQNSSSQSSNTIVIIVIIIASFTAFGCIVAIYYRCIKTPNITLKPNQNHVVSASSAFQLTQTISHLQGDENNTSWMSADIRFDSSQNCPICIDNNMQFKTHCGHNFHSKCIWQWSMKKLADCPLCKSRNLFPARIYCQHCGEKYYEADAKSIGFLIKQQQSKICDSCRQKALQ